MRYLNVVAVMAACLIFYRPAFAAAEAVGATAKNCEENQGAMDVGSGTTKIIAVTVDFCEKRILKVIFDERVAIAFNEAFATSSDQKIPEAFWKSAVPLIKKSTDKLRLQNVKKIYAVATAVFRNARNGPDVIAQMEKQLQIPIQIISQDQEAELGYWSTLVHHRASQEPQRRVMWDIGGGSMQMFAFNKKRPEIYRGHLASVSFKNEIIKTLQFKNPKEFFSPNPLGRQWQAAVQIAKNHAVLNVPAFFKKRPPDTEWVGIGGVLSLSVQKQVQANQGYFTADELEATLKQKALLSDSQLEGEYKTSDVTNLALVLGYMKALHIPKVSTVETALGQGLILKNLYAINSK